MSSGAVMPGSWLKVLAFRCVMIGLLWAWKIQALENAGNLFVFMIWLGTAVCFLGAMVPATGRQPVLSKAQSYFVNLYRALIVASLAWYGHPGLALAFVIGVIAAEVHFKKYDKNGMPLPKAGA